jgi:hypothetical protein
MLHATAERDRTKLPRDPFKVAVAPRPIGWISTRALDGWVDLALSSFFKWLIEFAANRRLLQRGARKEFKIGPIRTKFGRRRLLGPLALSSAPTL